MGLWQCSSCSYVHKKADNGPAAGLLSSFAPLYVSKCSGLSPGISSMLLTLCWATQQTFLPQPKLMCHPEWAALPGQLLWVVDTPLWYLEWWEHCQIAKVTKNLPEKMRTEKWSVVTTYWTIPLQGCLANCLSSPPVVCSICTTVGEIESQLVLLHNWASYYSRSVIDLELHLVVSVFPLFFWAVYKSSNIFFLPSKDKFLWSRFFGLLCLKNNLHNWNHFICFSALVSYTVSL